MPLSKDQKSALIRMMKNEISKDEFLKNYQFKGALEEESDRLLAEATQQKDGENLWYAFTFASGLGYFRSEDKLLKLYWELLPQNWHEEHESMISYLQDHPDPESVVAIDKAIMLKPILKYLDYDDYGAYYKKCFWALKAIGTEDALGLIHYYCDSDDEVIREQAQYRARKINA